MHRGWSWSHLAVQPIGAPCSPCTPTDVSPWSMGKDADAHPVHRGDDAFLASNGCFVVALRVFAVGVHTLAPCLVMEVRSLAGTSVTARRTHGHPPVTPPRLKDAEAGLALPTSTEADGALRHVSADVLRTMYTDMALARALDERVWQLSRQGAVPFAVTGRGHEAAQVGLAAAVRPGVDFVYAYYRDVALVLALGVTAEEIMLAAFGRRSDTFSGGRQMPGHFSHPALRIVSGSSPVGTQIPQGAGTALACRMRGLDSAVLVTFGEGATSQGDFHEGLNFAALHRLPVVFACENNGWAISVPQHLQTAGPGIAARAAGYGMHGLVVDGGDPLAVRSAAAQAMTRARRGDGPTLLELKVVRLDPHTSTDDDRTYRPAAERDGLAAADPLPHFRRQVEEILGVGEMAIVDAAIATAVDTATRAALQAPEPGPDDLMRDVYASAQASA